MQIFWRRGLFPFIFLLSFFVLNDSVIAFLPFMEEIQGNMESTSDNKEATITPTPNPIKLDPQWWTYFAVEGETLLQRIEAVNIDFQKLYLSIDLQDQPAASALINKVITTLNALPQAMKQDSSSPTNAPVTFLKTYTLEKQQELNLQLRRLLVDIQDEQEDLEELQVRLSTAQKNVDNMMVAYLGQTQPSSKKILNGLEIMAYRANIALGEQNLRLTKNRLERLVAKNKSLLEELEHAKQNLDVQEFDEKQLERNISIFQQELDKKQKELAIAEANLLGIFNDTIEYSYNNSLFQREQHVLQAMVNRANAWARMTFHMFKYNLIMHLNKRFQDEHHLRGDLDKWREQISVVLKQASHWKKEALKEQDRIRQEYSFLIAQNVHPDAHQVRFNQSLRQGDMQVLASLEKLEEEIINTQWLIDLLEEHFRKNSTVWENWSIKIENTLSKGWNNLIQILNFSLFKISGVPITLFTIIKVLTILCLSFWISLLTRASLISFGKKRGDMAESALYSLGSLAHYFILLLGFIIAFCSIGLDSGNLVFLAGAMTFGISLGLQSLANNFFCGLRILFERKLKIGDHIELHSGHAGKVAEIHVQNTVVRTSDGQKVIVPNSELIGNTLVNWTRQHSHDYRRLHISFAVASGCDKELVRQVIIEAAKRVPCSLKNLQGYSEPQVWLVNFSSDSLEFKLVVWVDHNGSTYSDSKESDFLWEIESALRQYSIPLPLPSIQQFLSSVKP